MNSRLDFELPLLFRRDQSTLDFELLSIVNFKSDLLISLLFRDGSLLYAQMIFFWYTFWQENGTRACTKQADKQEEAQRETRRGELYGFLKTNANAQADFPKMWQMVESSQAPL